MPSTYSRADVETHYGDSRPAVNVKVYGTIQDVKLPDSDLPADLTHDWVSAHCSDEFLDGLFWLVAGFEWEQIEQDAADIFGPGVKLEQDGRSGGWCVVHGLPDVSDWDAIQLAKWRKFERYARQIAAGVPYQMLASIACNEFAQWKARGRGLRRASMLAAV